MGERDIVITIKQKSGLEPDDESCTTWEWSIENIKEIKPLIFLGVLNNIKESLINMLAEDNQIPASKVRSMLLGE